MQEGALMADLDKRGDRKDWLRWQSSLCEKGEMKMSDEMKIPPRRGLLG